MCCLGSSDLKLFTSRAPQLIENENKNGRYAAPDKQELFYPIVPDNWHVILDIGIAIEKLMAPAPHENSGQQKNDNRAGEGDAQRRKTGRLDYADHAV